MTERVKYRATPQLYRKQDFSLQCQTPLNAFAPKITVMAIFLNSKQQKTYQGTLRTQESTPIGSQTSLGPSMDPAGTLAPLTILEHFFGHCGTQSGHKVPSWTFMDPQMDPKVDPARLISGDPW